MSVEHPDEELSPDVGKFRRRTARHQQVRAQIRGRKLHVVRVTETSKDRPLREMGKWVEGEWEEEEEE